MSAVDDRSERGFLERVGLTALGYPAYVTFLSANLVSNASWFVYAAALNTYILAVTGSAQDVGFASFVYSLPGALFMLHAGLLTDRYGAKRLVARCTELQAYIESNEGALIDYGQRHRAGKPISTSRAEGTVNQLVSARMNKRQQMRWSPRSAHRVLQVRTAVLDRRFGHPAIQLAA